MFQKFYTDTLAGRFIKTFLNHTPVPLFDSVVNGDHLISGCYYVYKNYIIQCVESGILSIDSKTEDALTPSEKLYPSIYLFVGEGYKYATFYVRSYVDEEDVKTCSTFNSSTNYYDSKTHYYLGRYLRYLYTKTGLNLFPFYNCYNSTYFTDIQLRKLKNVDGSTSITVERNTSQDHKVVGIPILFGHTYTISIDCPTEVIMRACVHDNTGYIDERYLTDVSNKRSTYTSQENSVENVISELASSGKIETSMKFNQPVKYRIETSNKELLMFQKDLYLVIQLPKNNDSSIVVLENYQDKTGVRCDKNSVRDIQFAKPILLQMNTRESYAFSDRLVEYLLGNVIHSHEYIFQNIVNIQDCIAKLNPSYAKSLITGKHKRGVWDNDISRIVLSMIEDEVKQNNVFDQDGNVNKDVEYMLYSKGVLYT